MSYPVVGSSPLTRGKHPAPVLRASARGLIPAHAGKTPSRSPRPSLAGAHPRSRGENPEYTSVLSRIGGSSPLTRGKPHFGLSFCVVRGLIPAHAGKTKQCVPNHMFSWAHPRSRGENSPGCQYCQPSLGSSPLTRGKQSAHLIPPVKRGLIPAHAGKTNTNNHPNKPKGAHPRSRGENDHRGNRVDDDVGSSPLTRGKRS